LATLRHLLDRGQFQNPERSHGGSTKPAPTKENPSREAFRLGSRGVGRV